MNLQTYWVLLSPQRHKTEKSRSAWVLLSTYENSMLRLYHWTVRFHAFQSQISAVVFSFFLHFIYVSSARVAYSCVTYLFPTFPWISIGIPRTSPNLLHPAVEVKTEMITGNISVHDCMQSEEKQYTKVNKSGGYMTSWELKMQWRVLDAFLNEWNIRKEIL